MASQNKLAATALSGLLLAAFANVADAQGVPSDHPPMQPLLICAPTDKVKIALKEEAGDVDTGLVASLQSPVIQNAPLFNKLSTKLSFQLYADIKGDGIGQDDGSYTLIGKITDPEMIAAYQDKYGADDISCVFPGVKFDDIMKSFTWEQSASPAP